MNERYHTVNASFMKGLATAVIIIAILGGVFFAGRQMNSSGSESTRAVGTIPTVPAGPGAPVPTGDIRLAAVTDEDWIKGDKNAPVTVVEFSDLECPFCKRFHPTLQQLVDEYDGKVNWVYRHFPLAQLHPKAAKEAEATECAGELGGNEAFWAYTDRIFEITPANNGFDLNELPQVAEDIGLDRNKFQTCLDSGKFAAKIQEHTAQAQAAGGRGTPHSIVVTADGETIPVQGAVPYEQLKSIVDSAL